MMDHYVKQTNANKRMQTNKQMQTNKCKQMQTNKCKQMQTNANKCKQMQTNKFKQIKQHISNKKINRNHTRHDTAPDHEALRPPLLTNNMQMNF